LAECRPGQVEVTIYNEHSGRIIFICVNENAVEHIGGEGDIVIPATCPCFTYENVEAELESNPNFVCWRVEGVTPTGENCTDILCCTDDICSGTFFQAVEGPEDFKTATCVFDGSYIYDGDPNRCETADGKLNPISEEKADACVVILDAIM